MIDGYIEEFYVGENEFIKEGTPLFKMRDLDKNYNLRLQKNKTMIQTQYQNTKGEILNLEKSKKNIDHNLKLGMNVYTQKFNKTKNKIESLKLQEQALQIEFATKKRNYDRTAALLKEGIVSKRDYDVAQNSFTKADAELKKIRLDRDIEVKNLSILVKENDKFQNEMNNKIITVKNNILAAKNRLKTLSAQLNKQTTMIQRYQNRTVVAKQDGYVVRILTNDKNKFIKRGDDILHYSPVVSKRALLVKISDFNMPLIKEGLAARIMFYGWPALQVSGWPKIQFGSFGGVVYKTENISHENGFYYAYIVPTKEEPWPNRSSLRIGSQATVWIRLSTVPIWYQLWRLMNAVPPRMVHPNSEKYE